MHKWWQNGKINSNCGCFYPSGSFWAETVFSQASSQEHPCNCREEQSEPKSAKLSSQVSHQSFKQTQSDSTRGQSVRVTFGSRRHERSCLCMKVQCQQGLIMNETMDKLNPKCEGVCIRMRSAMLRTLNQKTGQHWLSGKVKPQSCPKPSK